MTLLLPPKVSVATLHANADSKLTHRPVVAVFDTLLILAFLLGLYLPFQGVFRGELAKQIEEDEGRKAATFPEMKFKGDGLIRRPDTRSLKAFPGQFEKWFNDRIGFRKQLIQGFQSARYYGWTPGLLSTSPRSSSQSGKEGVLIGRDGWLFYRSDAALHDYRGTDLFTEAELAAWKKVLTERQRWLAKRGIRYVFVIVPEKHAIYPESMPGSITRVTTESRLNQLEDYLNRHADMEFLNLSDPLREAKSDYRVFHKTDTHWNAYGALIGARELLTTLRSWHPKITVPETSDYKVAIRDCDVTSIKDISPWVKMDLAVMLSSPIPQREELIDLVPLREEYQVPIQFSGPPRSDSERIQHRTSDRGELSKVYVIHDSCMMALAPFLAPHFQEVTYHWTDDFPAEQIDEARPVLVIQEMVGRRLMTHEPKNPRPVIEDLAP